MDLVLDTRSPSPHVQVPALPARVPRAVEPNAVISARIDLTPTMAIFHVRPDGPVPTFEPGQYLTLGLTVNGRYVCRPYSTASAAGYTRELEFLIRLVPGATFTPLLWTLSRGSRLRLGPPRGLFRLESGDTRTHLLVATGTGLAPLMSMVRTSRRRGAPRSVLVHGVSRRPELAFHEELTGLARERPDLTYRPVLSRPPSAVDEPWTGDTGRLDAALVPICDDLGLDPSDTVAYVCGNPGMIVSVESLLRGRGFPSAAIRTEGYWVP